MVADPLRNDPVVWESEECLQCVSLLLLPPTTSPWKVQASGVTVTSPTADSQRRRRVQEPAASTISVGTDLF